MPIPDFVLALREKIGHDPLPLPSVTAVVVDADDRVLLVRRADNGRWSLVSGCLEPGEEPAVGAVREVYEETAVTAVVERLVSIGAQPLTVCANGDQVYWFDVTFRCRAVGGEARVNDDESVDVGWFGLGEMPRLSPLETKRLADAFSERTEPVFATSGGHDSAAVEK